MDTSSCGIESCTVLFILFLNKVTSFAQEFEAPSAGLNDYQVLDEKLRLHVILATSSKRPKGCSS